MEGGGGLVRMGSGGGGGDLDEGCWLVRVVDDRQRGGLVG